MRNLQSQPEPPIYEPYLAEFILHVHQLLEIAHKLARARITGKSKEEDITGFLYSALKKYFKTDIPREYRNYEVKNEDPICDENDIRTGKSRRFIDLLFVYVTMLGRPEFVIEAKPLNINKKHQRTDNYTNKQALQRFLSGEYADYTADHQEVMMLGYVQSETTGIWRDRLKAAIEKNRITLRMLSEQHDVQIINEIEWTSEHSRNNSNKPLTIYHLLLDCCI